MIPGRANSATPAVGRSPGRTSVWSVASGLCGSAVFNRRHTASQSGRLQSAPPSTANLAPSRHPGVVARPPRRSAFTLLELLVVVGLIVILTGSFALALSGRGGEGAALVNAQSLVASLVGATRAQAALHQTKARLIVFATIPTANADASKYLRALIVVREEPPDSGRYVAAGDPVTLPMPVCVVPPNVPTNHLRQGTVWNNTVATGPVSTLTIEAGFNYRGQNNPAAVLQFFGAQGQSGRILYLEFGPDGSVTANGTSNLNLTKLAVTTAILSNSAVPQFNNSSGVRGLFVRKSGAISLVDEATGF